MATVSTGFFSNAERAAAEEEALLIVKGAQHFSLHRLSTTSKQVSYSVDLAFPARAIGEPQWEQLKKTGWTRWGAVDSRMETANDARGDQMIAITLRYYSKMQAGLKPDNTEQHVNVRFEDEHGPELAAWLQLDCSK
jgi:hypothetical protein